MHRILSRCSAAVVLCAASMVVCAQQTTPVPAEQKKITLADLKEENFHFEVASIRPNKSGERGVSWSSSLGGYRMTNQTLDGLVRGVYGIVLDDALINLPKWAEDERYDVNAKVDEETTLLWKQLSQEDKRALLERLQKNLLAERFGLKVHTEMRVLPAYDLVVAKSGLKMKESSDANTRMTFSSGKIEAYAMDLRSLVDKLSSNIDRKVIDKSGLGEKKFDIVLTWTPERSQTAENPGTSIYTALEEQLGLKLVATKAPVEVVVVDHIERPSEN
jgi:uncharacterized protein (TIGR03435 family)